MPAEELPANIVSPIKLSPRHTKMTPARMEHFLHQLGITSKQYGIWNGNWSLAKEIKANPTWSLRAWEVLVVECLEIIHNTEWK